MKSAVSIGLIGDYNAAVLAHQAIPRALDLAGEVSDVSVRHEWVPTQEIRGESRVSGFDGLWCVPASPYSCVRQVLQIAVMILRWDFSAAA